MLKLYFTYFIYGFFIFYTDMFLWGFSAGASNAWPYIILAGSLILFVIASTLSLHKVKAGAIVGAPCLLATVPMLINMMKAIGWSSKWFSLILLVVATLFMFGLVTTIRILIGGEKETEVKSPLKFILTAIPTALITWWVVAVLISR